MSDENPFLDEVDAAVDLTNEQLGDELSDLTPDPAKMEEMFPDFKFRTEVEKLIASIDKDTAKNERLNKITAFAAAFGTNGLTALKAAAKAVGKA